MLARAASGVQQWLRTAASAASGARADAGIDSACAAAAAWAQRGAASASAAPSVPADRERSAPSTSNGGATISGSASQPPRDSRSSSSSSSSPAASGRRAGSPTPGPSKSANDVLQPFLGAFRLTPPAAPYMRGMEPATALSWLRRRGPQVPHAVLHRLFRQRQIRLFDGAKVVRVRASRQLRPGERLLFPASLRQLQHGGDMHDRDSDTSSRAGGEQSGSDPWAAAAPAGAAAGAAAAASIHGRGRRPPLFAAAPASSPASSSSAPPPSSRAAGAAAAAAASGPSAASSAITPERARRWVLDVQPGVVFINKPAGVRVHGRAAGDADDGRRGHGRGSMGGGGGAAAAAAADAATLEGVLRRGGLRYGEHDEPRLVHRLDQRASGAMVLARDADAAAWLAAAFRGKAQRALRDRDAGAQAAAADEGEELSVARTYYAFVAGDLQPRQSGRIRMPIVVDGASLPAVTSYRVRGTGCGVSWLELSPETGRRHQLRVHCARVLGTPIIGDSRYGYRGLPPRLSLRERLPPAWWALLGEAPPPSAAQQQQHGKQQQQQQEPGPGGALPPPPILLHSRRLTLLRPGRSPLSGVAPLPRYMRELMDAAGWPLPRDST